MAGWDNELPPTSNPRLRVLRDLEENQWVVAIDGKIVELHDLHMPLHLVMEVLEEQDGACLNEQQDLDRVFQALLEMYFRWKFEEEP